VISRVAGRSASRRASVDFPAAIFPHRRYNVVMRSGSTCQGGPLHGQPKNLLVLSFTVFVPLEKSTRFSSCSKTDRAVRSRRSGQGRMTGVRRLRRARMSAVSLEAKIAMSPLEPRSKKRKVPRSGSPSVSAGLPRRRVGHRLPRALLRRPRNNPGIVCVTSHRPLRERVHRRKRVFAPLRGSTSDDVD
jgi:hypothetical protein